MSKVITFSRVFPAYHPKAGQPTYFVEKMWRQLYWDDDPRAGKYIEAMRNNFGMEHIRDFNEFEPKKHTIRVGNRWKAGDWFSPRVWSGKPYNSPQIIIAADIQIKKIYEISIQIDEDYICLMIDNYPFYEENKTMVIQSEALETLAKNDGLSIEEFKAWFKWNEPKFDGQIICWDESVNYG